MSFSTLQGDTTQSVRRQLNSYYQVQAEDGSVTRRKNFKLQQFYHYFVSSPCIRTTSTVPQG